MIYQDVPRSHPVTDRQIEYFPGQGVKIAKRLERLLKILWSKRVLKWPKIA